MDYNNNISQEEFEQIERHVLDSMGAEERLRFEEKLALDAALMEKYREVKSLLGALEEAALRDKLDLFHADIGATEKPAASQKQRSLTVWKTISVAASLALLMVVGFLFMRDKQEATVFASFYEPDPGLVTAMSSAGTYEFDRGMVDYKLGNFEKAAERWIVLAEQGTKSDTLYYFIGSAKLAMGRSGDAVPFLYEAAELQGSLANDAYWYLALALLKEGNKAEAAQALSNAEHPLKASLLDKLKNM